MQVPGQPAGSGDRLCTAPARHAAATIRLGRQAGPAGHTHREVGVLVGRQSVWLLALTCAKAGPGGGGLLLLRQGHPLPSSSSCSRGGCPSCIPPASPSPGPGRSLAAARPLPPGWKLAAPRCPPACARGCSAAPAPAAGGRCPCPRGASSSSSSSQEGPRPPPALSLASGPHPGASASSSYKG